MKGEREKKRDRREEMGNFSVIYLNCTLFIMLTIIII